MYLMMFFYFIVVCVLDILVIDVFHTSIPRDRISIIPGPAKSSAELTKRFPKGRLKEDTYYSIARIWIRRNGNVFRNGNNLFRRFRHHVSSEHYCRIFQIHRSVWARGPATGGGVSTTRSISDLTSILPKVH